MIATIIWMIRAAQHRLESNPMTSSQPLMNSIGGDKISHEMRKRYSGAGKGFIHPTGVAGDEELVASRNGEKRAERNAGEQDRKLLPRAVSE